MQEKAAFKESLMQAKRLPPAPSPHAHTANTTNNAAAAARAATPPIAPAPLPVAAPADGRDSLFGRFASKVHSPTDSAGKPGQQVSKGSAGAMSTMNELRDRMHERGDKLNMLSERSGELSNNASEFARLAKQLNEQQKSRWF